MPAYQSLSNHKRSRLSCKAQHESMTPPPVGDHIELKMCDHGGLKKLQLQIKSLLILNIDKI